MITRWAAWPNLLWELCSTLRRSSSLVRNHSIVIYWDHEDGDDDYDWPHPCLIFYSMKDALEWLFLSSWRKQLEVFKFCFSRFCVFTPVTAVCSQIVTRTSELVQLVYNGDNGNNVRSIPTQFWGEAQSALRCGWVSVTEDLFTNYYGWRHNAGKFKTSFHIEMYVLPNARIGELQAAFILFENDGISRLLFSASLSAVEPKCELNSGEGALSSDSWWDFNGWKFHSKKINDVAMKRLGWFCSAEEKVNLVSWSKPNKNVKLGSDWWMQMYKNIWSSQETTTASQSTTGASVFSAMKLVRHGNQIQNHNVVKNEYVFCHILEWSVIKGIWLINQEFPYLCLSKLMQWNCQKICKYFSKSFNMFSLFRPFSSQLLLLPMFFPFCVFAVFTSGNVFPATGQRPFLPNMSPGQWIDHVENKR